MAMGRKRKNPLGLPDRVYPKHGAFYYVHKDGTWEHIGTDVLEAKRKGHRYNNPESTFGTIAHYLDLFLVACEKRVLAGDMAKRTFEDYRRDVEVLKVMFGKYIPLAIEPKHVAQFLDLGVENNRAVRANREKACLSAFFTWMIRKGEAGVRTNPCIGIRRNKEKKRARYVEHDEYQAIRKLATKQVRALMDLVYRTLQRPEDIINWTPANIVQKREPDGTVRRVIRTIQDKTDATVDIEITKEIDAILRQLNVFGTITGPGMTLLHRQDGKPYTYDGLSAMLRRYIKKAGLTSFGYYDLKGKGATDMWLSGVPMEQIQVLCAHESIRTTEVYVKSRWRGTVTPNQVEIPKKKVGE